DLKKAFLQVEIQEDFRDVLRFLWVDEDFFQSSFNWKNFLRHLVTYRMKVVSFGLNASPFLLNVVIRKQASLCKDTYPKEAEILDKSMYVDDLTVGADTGEELIQLSSETSVSKMDYLFSYCLHFLTFKMREETEQDLPITKILGLCWEPNMDLIKYDKLQDFRRWTKRHLCSLLASVFDPLGLLAPALLELKLLIQRTWVEDIGWDEVLSEEYQSKYANWRQFFEKILCLEFPRWVGTLQSQEIFLEIYCDASLLAYGCVTLTWIISTMNVWKPYVTNRVHEILALTLVKQWYYVSTADNPADLLTRTDRAFELLTKTLWTQGLNIVEGIQYKEGQLPEPEEEKRSIISNVVNLVIEDSDFELELARFSNLNRMIRVFTWILRWKKSLGRELTLDELNITKNRFILQSFWFSPELRAIAEEGKVHKSSKICNPFKDNKGFLRLGGRLDQALLTSEEKHPIFLHHSSRLTKLLILDVHLQLKHGEVSEVLFHMQILDSAGQMNSSFCIKRLFSLSSKLEVPDPVFAPLPSERVTPANPFQHCGLDYLGPLQIRDQNTKLQKRCTLKLQSLNTEHFLLALRKFGALHGYPAKLFSDNSKTFHRANLELKTWGTLLSSSHISRFFSDKGICGLFIAPLVPNWGGVWERLVKLVKEKLWRVLRQDTCSLNVLDTHCKEISSIINSRPLVYVTESDGNEFSLTPEHFLTGNMHKVLLTKPTDKIRNKDLRRLEKTRRKNIYTFWQTW
uniref:Integrase catalytic domain-containing protein n=1 Tax=Strigamia maritima TaxID=126957 RepID=T1J0W3_STRMM